MYNVTEHHLQQIILARDHLCSRIFIKSAVDPTNVKFGVLITWVNTIVQNFYVAIATSVN